MDPQLPTDDRKLQSLKNLRDVKLNCTLSTSMPSNWEHARFYLAEFDGAFYLRHGPSAAFEGEDDVPKLLSVRRHRSTCRFFSMKEENHRCM